MLDGKKALALSMQYTEDSLDGVGAIAGKPCQIQSITDITGGHRITFLWVDNEDVSHTSTLDVMDGQNGKGIASIEKKSTEGLVDTYTITYTDGTTFDFEVTNGADGVGVPEGGTTGQVLAKKSNSDYDTEWVNGGGGDVSSVNGKTGAVVLDADDVGAVEKVQGKGLSENDYTDTDKAIVDGVTTALAEKVDKVSGKGLSENDYTNEDKTLVGTISSKANQTEVDDISNVYGAKNLLPYPYYSTTKTQNGITFTDNGDGTVTVNGTATDGVVFFCSIRGENGKCILPNGTYIVTGCPSGGAVNSYKIGASRISGGSGTSYGTDVGNGLTVELDGDDFSDDDVRLQIGIAVSSGTVCDNLVFKPMVRLASIKDDTYVPHVPTNAKLDETKVSWDDASESVQKNLNIYPYVATTNTVNGVTFTDLGDGRIQANGTATADAIFSCHIRTIGTSTPLFISNGRYIISGCPSGGSLSTYLVGTAITKNGSGSVLAYDYGNGKEFIINGDDTYTDKAQVQIQLIVKSGQTVNNLIFSPMLRKATIKDDTWQPYVPTNKALKEQKVSYKHLGEVGAKNLLTYPYTQTTKTSNGVTFTDNGDGTITADGTATAVASMFLRSFTEGDWGYKKGTKYILSGCPQGGAVNSYKIVLAINYNGSFTNIYDDIGDGIEFTTPNNIDGINVYIWIDNGQTVSNLTFKPMLRRAEDTDSTYQPYAMTNKELTKDMMYSTSEINTGKKWIDGKPIYRKVIDIGTLPDTTTKSVAHGITNFDLCISLVGVVKNSTSRLTIPSVWNDVTETIGIYANGTSVIVSTSKDRSSFSGYAILEYTKSTD